MKCGSGDFGAMALKLCGVWLQLLAFIFERRQHGIGHARD
jgi:hypothetical protein